MLASISGSLTIFQAVAEDKRPAVDQDWMEFCAAYPSRGTVNDELRRGVLGSSADCVKVLDFDGRLIYMSPGGRQIMAVDDFDAVRGADWLAFWTGEHRQLAANAVEMARRGEVGRFTGRCAKLNGEVRWWDVVVSPMRNAEGGIERLLSVSRDVTEMKSAQLREVMERSVWESVASNQPVSRTLDRICELAEASCDHAFRCAVFGYSDTTHGLLIAMSAPSQAEIVGMPAPKEWRELPGVPCAALPLSATQGTSMGALVIWGAAPPQQADQEQLESCARLATIVLERDEHQRRLRFKQERLAIIGRAAPVGLYHDDDYGFRIYSNERMQQITGLTVEQARGDGWLKAVHPEDHDWVAEQWCAGRRDRTEFQAEFRLKEQTADGGVRWVMALETPVEGGGQVGTLVEITPLKSALAEVSEGAERFRMLANNMSQLCWMANAEGWVVWYNDRWYEYTGTTLEQMEGWGWQSVHHPDHVERVTQKIARCWKSGEVWEDTFPLRGRDGAYRWFLSRAVPIRNEDGKVIRWFGTNTDITSERQLAIELNRQVEALEQSNMELSRFAFVASHDLQEPLREITTYTQMLQRSAVLEAESKRYAESIVNSAKRMRQLIRDLLSYARTSHTESGEAAATVSLNKLVDDLLLSMHSPIYKAQARVTRGDLPEVLGVATQLHQVFQNLISNSIKYARAGVPPEIHISSFYEGPLWRITVEDNGQGFAAEYAEKIFDFMTRLHGREVPGTGLGLAIVKSIITRHGGAIHAQGEPGKGARFTFTLRDAFANQHEGEAGAPTSVS